MHLDVEEIERLVAGELRGAALAAARAHVAECRDCAGRVNAAQSADAGVADLLHQLDTTPPRVSAENIIAAATPKARPRWGLRAASVVLLLGAAAAAYALTGSPVRKWLGVKSEAAAPPPRLEPAATPGIALEPSSNLLIVFARAQSTGEIRVALVDSGLVVVQSRGGAAAFNSEDERLAIDNHDAGVSFDIRIPRATLRVEIRVGDRRVFLKAGPDIDTGVREVNGTYRLRLQ